MSKVLVIQDALIFRLLSEGKGGDVVWSIGPFGDYDILSIFMTYFTLLVNFTYQLVYLSFTVRSILVSFSFDLLFIIIQI